MTMRPLFQCYMTPRRLLVAIGTLLTISLTAPVQAGSAGEVMDPHYGDTLFQFYQDRQFTALMNLMVSQHFDRMAHHTDDAEVLKGGILLSYGLTHEAREIFPLLTEKELTAGARDRAWLYLAKISYQRGYPADAENAIGHIGNALPTDLQEERRLLLANLLMARADYPGAIAVLSPKENNGESARYIRYNLGIAMIKSGDVKLGSAILNEVGHASAENEEFRSLRDRANVALGFAALTEKRPEAARNFFERVRLKSMEANKALLGLGWVASALNEHSVALGSWLELAKRDISDSAVLEAHLAIPYAYAKLGAYGQSAKLYNDAIGTFARESASIDDSIAKIRSGKVIDALIENNPGNELGWFWSLRDVTAMPHASHLTHMLAQHEFQESLKNCRDLRFLMKNLEEWCDKLAVFNGMLENRRKAFANHLPQVTARQTELELDRLRKRRADVAGAVSAGETAADGVAFADTKQLALQQRVASVQNTLKDSSGNPNMAASNDRARLAAGALTWQLAQDYPTRLWQAKKELQTISDEIDKAQRLDAALNQAQRDEPARFESFAKRIDALTPVLQVMIPRVAALNKEQQKAVQDMAIVELTRLQERLATYSSQARFAMAQLYDRDADRSTDTAPQKEGR